VLYQQRRLTDPAVSTGEYGDFNVTDEWYWAATELYLLTGDQQFADVIAKNQPKRFSAPTWGNVAALGTYDLLMQGKSLPSPLGEGSGVRLRGRG
jgi:endoglucanase